MSLEDKLTGWTGPSSATEQEKQERTERMIREAVNAHEPFKNCSLSVYVKGSYANKTNIKVDSDVDIAVQCKNVRYWDEAKPGAHPASASYQGIWTPAKLRAELISALESKFPGKLDTSGSTAIQINSSSARVDADVVPCFNYRYYFSSTSYREGAKVFKKDGTSLKNYPNQQLENGIKKNSRTSKRYKKTVRIMKRVENLMFEAGRHKAVPSYFVECLVYNVPDNILLRSTWTEVVKKTIYHIWSELEGNEPSDNSKRWREVNGCKYLFHANQPWTRADARSFVKSAWNYLGYSS